MVKTICLYGSLVLRRKSVEMETSEDIAILTSNLYDTLKKTGGIGLASPQIGILKRVFIIDTSLMNDENSEVELIERAYINPQIVWRSEDLTTYSEGCLSIPDIYEEVERPEKITVTYHDESFNKIERTLEGLESRIFQHEFDHLEGVLFIDRVNPLKRILLSGKLKAISKQSKLHKQKY